MLANGPGNGKCGISNPLSCPPTAILFCCEILFLGNQPAFAVGNIKHSFYDSYSV